MPPNVAKIRGSRLNSYAQGPIALTLAALCLTTAGCTAATQAAPAPSTGATPKLGAIRVQTEESTAPSKSRTATSASLTELIRHALKNSPELEASYEHWRSVAVSEDAAGRLPEPVLSYGYFVRSVETRVGPQKHRLGVSQSFPWPAALSHGAKSVRLRARAAKQRYEAMALSLVQRVSDSYWHAWLQNRSIVVERERKALLRQMSRSIGSRVEVGQATLADLAQVNVAVTRAENAINQYQERYESALAVLRAVIGGKVDHQVQIPKTPPSIFEIREPEARLLEQARAHPRVRALAAQSEAQLSDASREDSNLYPGFSVGVDYIQTDEGPIASADNGKDPLMVSLSIKVPLWAHLQGNRGEASRAMSRSIGATLRAEELRSRAKTLTLLSKLRETARRCRLFESSLLPQAQAMYGSVLGSYQAGRSSVAQALLASEQLLTLSAELYAAQAEHARSLAQLQAVVGRPILVKVSE